MPEEIKVQQVMEAVTALREEVESKASDQEKIINIEKSLNTFEKKGQELVTAMAEADQKAVATNELIVALEEKAKGMETKSAETLEIIHNLEIEIARGGGSVEKDYKNSDEFKALQVFVTKGAHALSSEEKAFLRTDSDTQGGFLAPTEMDNAITKKIVEVSDIRSIARVRTIASKSMELPVRATIPAATYEGEAETGADSTSTYENETVLPFRQTFTTPITQDMLMDAAFDMESEIMTDAAEAFALGEGTGFVNGTGFKQPSGFLVDSRVGGLTSAASGVVDGDDIINITGELKTGYNPVYVFNRRTMAVIRTLKSTDGVYLWAPGLNGVVANTINGFPYLLANDMPDIAALSKSVAFGDFLRGYTIVDRTGLNVIRDEFTLKKKGMVEFTMNRWNTGQVTLPEALKILTTAA